MKVNCKESRRKIILEEYDGCEIANLYQAFTKLNLSFFETMKNT